MNLKFLGRGAAFNPKEGNTSAYFIENNELFLIDCGQTVFSKIIEKNLLENIDKINIMISHTHSDHIGSLETLIMYSYFVLKIKINIIVKESSKNLDNIVTILNNCGCKSEMYELVNELEYDNKYKSFTKIRFLETKHCDGMNCYGLIFYTENGIVYYSGDTKNIDTLQEVLNLNYDIDKLYIDVTTINSNDNVHINIDILNNFIPSNLKEKVYCMHFNNDECIEKSINYGFNVVQVIKLV